MSRTFGPDEMAALESERDFLLRSLDDLETERAAGNLDGDRYAELKDDYTARAAAVLRSIAAGAEGVDEGLAGGPDVVDDVVDDVAPSPPGPPRSARRHPALIVGAIVAFVAIAGVALAWSVGDRDEGQTATGNDQTATGNDQTAEQAQQPSPEARQRRDEAAAEVGRRPDDPQAHFEYAKALLDTGDIAQAVKEFDSTAQLDPSNGEALAYGGWVVFLASRSDPASPAAGELTDAALRRLDAAVAAAPDYPDAHFFRGMVLLRGRNDPAAAVPELERYLALAPDGPMSQQVQGLLDAARQESGR